jgi:hypothetical protein
LSAAFQCRIDIASTVRPKSGRFCSTPEAGGVPAFSSHGPRTIVIVEIATHHPSAAAQLR